MSPILAVSQVGFLSGPCPKRAYLVPWTPEAKRFKLVSVETCHLAGGGAPDQARQSGEWTAAEGPIAKCETPFGVVGVMDFSAVLVPGHYRVQALPGGGGAPIATSIPFFVRRDLYLRTAYEAFYFSHIQRCGSAVPGWHDVCHLDDARRRDNGAHVDTVGGWHDAGDLRKWMVATMWQALGMLHVRERRRPDWHTYADDDILDELKCRFPDPGGKWVGAFSCQARV
ncbi:MAG: glycoside hydrolase family 9 protein [Planctomycetota bacterium]